MGDIKRLRQHIRATVEAGTGDTLTYTDCPECGRDGRLMIGPAKEGGYWGKCLSASCGIYTTTNAGLPAEVPATDKVPERRQYEHYKLSPQYQDLTVEARDFLKLRFTLDDASIDVLTPGKLGAAYVYPVRAPDARLRGYVERRYGGGIKTLTRPYSLDSCMIAWYCRPDCKHPTTLCVTEDQVSAARLSGYFHTVALLGTSLSDAGAEEIILQKYPRTYVLFDSDATMKALSLAHRLPNAMPIPIFEEDVKDMAPATLDELIGYLNHD